MTHGKTYNKLPRRINHKATKSKTNTGTTALERSVEQTTAGFKALLQLANFTLGPDATLNTEIHKNSVRIKAPNSVNASKRKHKNQINHYNKLDLELIKTNMLSMIHDDCLKNVTTRVLIRLSADLARWPSFLPQVIQFRTWPRNHQDRHFEQDSWWLLKKCDR